MSNLSTFLNDGNLIDFLNNNKKVNKTSTRPPALIFTPTVQETYLSDFLKDGNLNTFLDNKKSPTAPSPPDMPSPSGPPTPSPTRFPPFQGSRLSTTPPRSRLSKTPSGSPKPPPSTLPGPSTALTDLLLADPKSIEPARGRPLFFKGETKYHINITDIPGQASSQERLDTIAQDIKNMLALYEFDPAVDKYAFEEYWYSRVGNPDSTAAPLTLAEKNAILNGDTNRFQGTFRVLFFLRKVNIYDSSRMYTLHLDGFTLAIKLPVITFDLVPANLGLETTNKFDITTIGIDIGKPFQLPKILFTGNPDAVSSFIFNYNDKINTQIQFLKNDIGSQSSSTTWKELKNGCMANWLELLNTVKTKELSDWTVTNDDFEINTLTRYTADLCSCFTWWNNRNLDLVPFKLQENEENVNEGESKDYALYRDNKMLIPRMEVSSYKKIKSQIFFGKDIFVYKGTKPLIKKISKITNPYIFLANAGTQPIELASLASILGSGCHNSAALEEIKSHPKLPTAISSTKYLEKYLDSMPPITKAVGEFIKGMFNTVSRLSAVEFPIYHCDRRIPTGVCYSRIDAITENFTAGEGYAVWEYKTRWGANVSFKAKADVNDANQALYYCWRLHAMTGIQIKYFYVLYVHVVNISDPTTDLRDKDSVQLKMYVHRYEINKNALHEMGLKEKEDN